MASILQRLDVSEPQVEMTDMRASRAELSETMRHSIPAVAKFGRRTNGTPRPSEPL